MIKKWICLLLSSLLFLITVFSGCQNILPNSPIMYAKQPVAIHYTLTYGYWVNCSGSGRYEITYLCDLPEVLQGSLSHTLLSFQGSQSVSLVNNTFVRWNLSSEEDQTYQLGVTAQCTVESFLVPDLTGNQALTLQDLKNIYPQIMRQYTRPQANDTITFIDPDNPNIQTISRTIRDTTQTNNSFLLAKAVFVWLKDHTRYQIHSEETVQPAAATLQKGTGDCDDLSFLYISLCRAMGIPARFIRGYLLTVVGNSTVTATAHAWAEVFVGESIGTNGWVPVECACCTTSIEADMHQNFGVENAYHLRLFTDDGSNASLDISLSGISYVVYGLNRQIAATPFAQVTNYQEVTSKNLVVTDTDTRYYE